jgi:hypothetical protein
MRKIIMLAGLALFLSGCGEYSSGSRVGVVQKLSHKGLFCKTWEGSMMLGGLVAQPTGEGGTNMVANVFDFTIEDHAVLRKVQAAMQSGTKVELTYRQEIVTFCRSDNSGDYFVTDVKEVK